MQETLTVHIPRNIQMILNRTPEELGRDLRLYAALMLFQLGKLSSGAAAEMAGIPKVMFLDLCADYNIPISQITPDDLRYEVEGGETLSD
jgi:predicted HTH domain antitoxin